MANEIQKLFPTAETLCSILKLYADQPNSWDAQANPDDWYYLQTSIIGSTSGLAPHFFQVSLWNTQLSH